MFADRGISHAMVARVRDLGFEALMLTVYCPMVPNREYNARNGFTVPFSLSIRSAGPLRIDVDTNTHYDALTDGLLIVRYLFGLKGSALVDGAIGTGATRTTAEIEAYILSLMPGPTLTPNHAGTFR